MGLVVDEALHIFDNGAAHSRGVDCRQGGAIHTLHRSLQPPVLLAQVSFATCDGMFQHDVNLQSSRLEDWISQLVVRCRSPGTSCRCSHRALDKGCSKMLPFFRFARCLTFFFMKSMAGISASLSIWVLLRSLLELAIDHGRHEGDANSTSGSLLPMSRPFPAR